MSVHVHWHEGLFLQPHHFQLLERGFFEQTRAERRLAWHYPYGVIESRLMVDELQNGWIRFEKLRALMPSGVEIDYPESAEVPTLDIKAVLARAAKPFIVSLGVPLWTSARANAFRPGEVPDPRVKLLYRLKEISREDENTGDNPRQLQVRMLNARLMLEEEDRSDMEVLPLLRIQRDPDRKEDVPRLDPRFVPPSLLLNGAPTLKYTVTELANRLKTVRDEQARKTARGGLSADTRTDRRLRLRTLGRFAGSLLSLVEAPAATPFEVFLALRELQGELAAAQPQPSVEDFECRPYQHDDPLPGFEELDTRIRRMLVEEEEKFIRVPFQKNAKGNPQVTLTRAANPQVPLTDLDYFTRPTGYFLGIKTRVERTKLVTYVKDDNKFSRFKFMPATMEGAPQRGVELYEDEGHGLPAEPGLYYFRINRESRRWAIGEEDKPKPVADQMPTVERDKSAVLEWRSQEFDLSDATFTLFLTLP